MVFIGFDWSRTKHDFLALDTNGHVLQRSVIPHDADAFDELRRIIAAIEPNPAAVQVGIELHDGALLFWLLEQGYTVYGINPKSANRARDRYRPSGSKDDSLDAYVLADMVRTDRGRLRPIRAAGQATRELHAWVRLRSKLTQDKTAACQRLRGLLDEWSPVLSGLCDDFNRRWQQDLLALCPLHEDLCQWHGNRLNAFAKNHRLRVETRQRIHAARTHPPIAIPAGLKAALRMESRHFSETIARLSERLAEVDRQLAQRVAEHPDAAIFQSLPVKGTATVAAFLCAFGQDRDHAPHWRELAARWGAAPVTVQSGKSRHVKRRRACDHVLNQAFLFFAFNTAFTEDCWAADYYKRKRAAGVDHYTALRCLAQRWIKILHRLWRNRVAYDEKLHQKNRLLHGGLAA